VEVVTGCVGVANKGLTYGENRNPVLWGVLSTAAAWGKHLLETWSVREDLDGIFINSIRKWGPVMGGGRLLSTPKHAAVLQT